MMKHQALLLALSSVVAYANAGAVELDLETFELKVTGKNAFVKFLAPW